MIPANDRNGADAAGEVECLEPSVNTTTVLNGGNEAVLLFTII